MRRRLIVPFVLAAVLAAAGCTTSGGDGPTSPGTVTQTIVSTAPPPPVDTTPVSTGPTTSAQATVCPLLAQQPAANKVGMRLGRITVQRSGGKVVGCDFYAVQGTSFDQSEHLPGPNQPAIDIKATTYRSHLAAYNSFVTIGKAGANVQQFRAAPGNIGLCYQIEFYAKDKGADWACGFNKGVISVQVKTVVSKDALNAEIIARAIAAKF